MKRYSIILAALMIIGAAVLSCRNGGGEKKTPANSTPAGLIQIGKDVITDVILKPDSLGDPWEFEKIKGFDGNVLFKTLVENIEAGKMTVYSVIGEEPMKPADVRKILDEFGSDLSRIGKMQFHEDWFFDPATGNVVKQTRSIILGYVIQRETGLPPSYKAMFMVKPE